MKIIALIPVLALAAACGADEEEACTQVADTNVIICGDIDYDADMLADTIRELERLADRWLGAGYGEIAPVEIHQYDDLDVRGRYLSAYERIAVAPIPVEAAEEAACIERYYIIAHELIHHMLYTRTGDSDPTHTVPAAWDGADYLMYEYVADMCSAKDLSKDLQKDQK